MPTYEYRCENGHLFEAIQRMADPPLQVCEVCGAPVQRVMHAPAVHFKGKGFYNTDYGTKKRQRELASSAENGADKHDAKQAEKSGSASGGSDSGSGGSGSSGSGGSGSSGSGGSGSSGGASSGEGKSGGAASEKPAKASKRDA